MRARGTQEEYLAVRETSGRQRAEGKEGGNASARDITVIERLLNIHQARFIHAVNSPAVSAVAISVAVRPTERDKNASVNDTAVMDVAGVLLKPRGRFSAAATFYCASAIRPIFPSARAAGSGFLSATISDRGRLLFTTRRLND